MSIGFKRSTNAIIHVPTPSGSLIQISGSGGHQAAGNVAINVLSGTGYSNFYTDYTIPVQFTPGVAKKYDLQMQGYRFLGECSIKVDTKYSDLLASGSHITIGTVEWNYARLSELGVGFGNDRIVLALNRRKDA